MTCTRCQGLMLDEQMIDMEADYGAMWSCSSRCFNCGHRDDAVLQHHRQLHAHPIDMSHQTMSTQEAWGVVWRHEDIEQLAA